MQQKAARIGRLRRITDREHLDEIFQLRHEVWYNRLGEQPFFKNGRWRDEHDVASAIQVAAIHQDRIVAAARLTLHATLASAPYGKLFPGSLTDRQGPFAFFSRLVVHPQYQGRGLARRLDQVRKRIAASCGARTLAVVTSNPHRVSSLARCGFKPTGDKPALTDHGVVVTTLANELARR